MKKLLWIIIIALLVTFTPVITYENELQNGVVVIEHRSIFEVVKERYEKVQTGVGVVSSEVSEVPGKDVVPEGKHVQ